MQPDADPEGYRRVQGEHDHDAQEPVTVCGQMGNGLELDDKGKLRGK